MRHEVTLGEESRISRHRGMLRGRKGSGEAGAMKQCNARWTMNEIMHEEKKKEKRGDSQTDTARREGDAGINRDARL
jgi:hypothetical protein